MLNKLLTEDVIKLNLECDSWEEAIKSGTALLIEKKLVEKRYEDAIIERFKELGPYMVIAPGIVLSHARPENGVNKISLSLITLKNPINFGSDMNDPVKLIVTLAAIDNESHVEVLKELMELFMDSEDLDFIMNTENCEEVLRIIDKHSYNY